MVNNMPPSGQIQAVAHIAGAFVPVQFPVVRKYCLFPGSGKATLRAAEATGCCVRVRGSDTAALAWAFLLHTKYTFFLLGTGADRGHETSYCCCSACALAPPF